MSKGKLRSTLFDRKRILVALLFLALIAAFTACGGGDNDSTISLPLEFRSPPVGPLGASFTYSDPDNPNISVTMNVPAGAVSADTIFSVTADTTYRSDPAVIDGLGFEFGPAGMSFNPPITISITYDPAALGGVRPETLTFYKRVGNTWQPVFTSVDPATNTVTASITGFSIWYLGPNALIESDPPTTTASPPGGVYTDCVSVTLSCDDGQGVGCRDTYYILTGMETTQIYIPSQPIQITTDATLKFFSNDILYNLELPRQEQYTVSGCQGPNTPPQNTTVSDFINNGDASTSSLDLSLAISASDDTGVTGYYIQADSNLTPAPDDPGWISIANPSTAFHQTVIYTYPDDTAGVKRVYVFFKDADGAVSAYAVDTIEYVPGGTPGQTVFIDFQTTPDGSPMCGGAQICSAGTIFAPWGVSFDFTDASVGGGSGLPYIQRFFRETDYFLTNDQIGTLPYGQALAGRIVMRFQNDPQLVTFELSQPAAASIELNAYSPSGSKLPASAITQVDNGSTASQTITSVTVSWGGGIRDVSVYGNGWMYIDDLAY